jgi:hypothetical protein
MGAVTSAISTTICKASRYGNFVDNSENRKCGAVGSKDMTLSRVRGFDAKESADKVSLVCGGNNGTDMCVTGREVIISRMILGPACMALK